MVLLLSRGGVAPGACLALGPAAAPSPSLLSFPRRLVGPGFTPPVGLPPRLGVSSLVGSLVSLVVALVPPLGWSVRPLVFFGSGGFLFLLSSFFPLSETI